MFIRCENHYCGGRRQFLLLNTDRITTVRPSLESNRVYDVYFEPTEFELQLFGKGPVLFRSDDLYSIGTLLNSGNGQD